MYFRPFFLLSAILVLVSAEGRGQPSQADHPFWRPQRRIAPSKPSVRAAVGLWAPRAGFSGLRRRERRSARPRPT